MRRRGRRRRKKRRRRRRRRRRRMRRRGRRRVEAPHGKPGQQQPHCSWLTLLQLCSLQLDFGHLVIVLNIG